MKALRQGEKIVAKEDVFIITDTEAKDLITGRDHSSVIKDLQVKLDDVCVGLNKIIWQNDQRIEKDKEIKEKRKEAKVSVNKNTTFRIATVAQIRLMQWILSFVGLTSFINLTMFAVSFFTK